VLMLHNYFFSGLKTPGPITIKLFTAVIYGFS
jgi:hypothetical protein